MSKKLISKQLNLVGDFVEIRELLEKLDYKIISIVDGTITPDTSTDAKLYTSDEDFINSVSNGDLFITPDNPSVRQKLFNYYSGYSFTFVTLVCPTAVVSKSAILLPGSCIQSKSLISSKVEIGEGVKVNCNAIVMHGCKIDSYTTVAPSAVLLGNVAVGKCCYIGANATILPGLKIGDNSIVGAGSVVTKNVPDNVTVYGNPAKG